SEIGTRTSCSLIPSPWPWMHTMDPIESPPFLRSNSRWRMYHRVRGTLRHLPGSLLIHLSQEPIQIITDESSFLSNLFHGRKRSCHGAKAAGRNWSWDGNGKSVFQRGSDVLLSRSRS